MYYDGNISVLYLHVSPSGCILGCQLCVDTWYRGAEGKMKKCPICRNERAYPETAMLKGFDEFLQAIAPILGKEQDEWASICQIKKSTQVLVTVLTCDLILGHPVGLHVLVVLPIMKTCTM